MLFQGLPHQGQQCRQCLLVNAIQNQVAHARFPKFMDVRGNAALGLFLVGEGGEKFANLIGHAHQILNVHDVLLLSLNVVGLKGDGGRGCKQ